MGPTSKFDSTWGDWAFGDPNWSCSDDGSERCTNFDCDNSVLNAKNDDDLRLAVYVTQSIINLHAWFTVAAEASTDASIFAALSKDNWVVDFYEEDGDGLKGLKETLSTAGIVIGVVLSFAAAQPELGVVVAGTLGSTNLLANTVPGLLLPHIKKEQKDNSFESGAIIGQALGRLAVETHDLLTIANNDIMDGNGTNTDNMGSTASDYFHGGTLLNYQGVDKIAFKNQMTGLFQAKAINLRMKEQSVYIMGGGPCEGDEGIGIGPEEYKFCDDDNTAWYLYHYGTKKGSGGKRVGAGVRAPHGMEKLGQGDYEFVTVKDIIKSSRDAFKVGRLDYTESMAVDRIKNAIENGEGKPFEPSWEGIFTIPVCDVSMIMYHDWPKDVKSKILVPYGKTPVWCGPICDDDNVNTESFYKAAHLDDLEDPFEGCIGDLSGAFAVPGTVAANMKSFKNMTLS